MQFKYQDNNQNSNQSKRQQKQQKSTKRSSKLRIHSKVYNQKLYDSKFQIGINQSCQTDVEVQSYVSQRRQTNVIIVSKEKSVEFKKSQQKQQHKQKQEQKHYEKHYEKQRPNSKNKNKKQQQFDQEPKREASKNKSQQFYPIPQPDIIPVHLLSKPQLKYKQSVKQKMIQSKYPQNVMKRVYPSQVQYKQQQQKHKEQQDDYFRQSRYQRQEIKRYYEHVQWSRYQYKVLVGNLKWMSLSFFYKQLRKMVKQQLKQNININNNNINNNDSNEYIDIDKHNDPDRYLEPQINKQLSLMIGRIKDKNKSSLIQTQQQITQHILQLQCLLRYRHVQQILSQLGQIVQSYYEHNELFGLEDVFGEKAVAKVVGKDNQWFFNRVIEIFVKLVVMIVSEYQYVSEQNKSYISKVFCDGQKGLQIKKQRQQQQDLSIMLESQRIFEPYKKVLKAIKYNRPLNQTTHPIAMQRQFKKNQKNQKDNKDNDEIQI